MPKRLQDLRPSRETAIGWLVVAATAVLVLVLHSAGALSFLGRLTYGLAFDIRGAREADGRVVIIAVDQKTKDELGTRMKDWTREQTARLVDAASDGGAVVVGLDYIFSGRAREKEDAAFAEAVGNANVVLACHLDEGSDELEKPIGDFFDPAADRGALDIGHINLPLDADARATRLVYYVRKGDEQRYAIALVLVANYEAALAEEGALPPLPAPYDEARDDGLRWGRRLLPWPEMLLNFAGPPGTYDTVSAIDVMEGRAPADAFDGKIVLVGVTQHLERDVFPTPVHRKFPGVELHATAVGNVLSGDWIVPLARARELGLLVALAVAATLAFGHAGMPTWGLIGGATALALGAAVVWAGAFVGAGFYADPSPFILMAVATSTAGGAYHWMRERRRARRIEGLFGSYVSRNVVRALLAGEVPFTLEGRRRELTMLFSDIRGFTSISERMSPGEVSAFLNRYFGGQLGVVFAADGTLDKLMGDCIMAFFGDPVPQDDHAARACRCALAMSGKLDEIRASGEGTVLEHLGIGIGLNTGEVTVGNLGCADPEFVDYTVIGDEVNLASRLEGLTRVYGVRVVVSDATREAAGGGFVFRPLDRVAVKGKTKPVDIHELVGESPADEERARLHRRFEEAMLLYKARRFEDAASAFEALEREFPDDGPSRLYAERAREFARAPPPADWRGVTVMKTK